jgi:hypothetical protein
MHASINGTQAGVPGTYPLASGDVCPRAKKPKNSAAKISPEEPEYRQTFRMMIR